MKLGKEPHETGQRAACCLRELRLDQDCCIIYTPKNQNSYLLIQYRKFSEKNNFLLGITRKWRIDHSTQI